MSTDDRALLEAAALAAGHGVEFDAISGLVFYGTKSSGLLWNPLHNDGDALRLAVKCGFQLDIETACGVVSIGGISERFDWGNHEAACAATRRAIVRAAAAMAPSAQAPELAQKA